MIKISEGKRCVRLLMSGRNQMPAFTYPLPGALVHMCLILPAMRCDNKC